MIHDHRTNRTEPPVVEDLDTDPRTLTPEQRDAWNRAQERLERAWLDRHIRTLSPYAIAA